MDKMLERLNRIYPNSHYVLIPKYDESQWKDREYDSKFDTKAALNRWQSKPLSYDDAQAKADEGYRIGWVVPKGMVVVDIDNVDDPRSQEVLETLLKKFEVSYSYNYTSKGMHLLFVDRTESIKSDSRTKCALNIAIDTRANSSGYIILPCNDPHRTWGKWNDFVEDIPYFLKPLLKDNTPSFIGLSEGDGRNNALFKWRTKLEQSHKLSAAEVEKSIRIINENLFETPMPNSELFKTVLRKIEEKPDNSDKENIYNKLADDLLSKIDLISYYDNFYQFNGIYYKPITITELERIIHYELSHNLSQSARREIVAFLKIKTQVKAEDFDKDWHKIACKNGVLNLVTGEVEQPNKSEINTIYIPFSYDDNPYYSPKIDQFMKDVTGADPLKMEFLYQIVGYCLLKRNLFQKFFIMVGEGGTGKSTFTNLIQKLVTDDNCSHVSLSDFDRDYYLATIIGKLVNIDDDVADSKLLEYTGRFKSVVSGDKISVRQIYREVEDHIPFATLIFNCNKLPKIMDRTTGLYRRIILIELNNKVKHPDPMFLEKLNDQDMEYFLYKAVQGIKTAIDEGHFRITYSEDRLINLFKRRQSPVNEWLYENEITLGDLHNAECAPLYAQFSDWCLRNGYQRPMTAFSFKEEIRSIFDLEIKFENCGAGSRQFYFKRGNFDPKFRPF